MSKPTKCNFNCIQNLFGELSFVEGVIDIDIGVRSKLKHLTRIQSNLIDIDTPSHPPERTSHRRQCFSLLFMVVPWIVHITKCYTFQISNVPRIITNLLACMWYFGWYFMSQVNLRCLLNLLCGIKSSWIRYAWIHTNTSQNCSFTNTHTHYKHTHT